MTMNLSSNKVTAGETLTITCFTCGMPSSKEWAQKIRSRLSNSLRPYYPFLLQVASPNGAVLREDGSTFVCAFCHASLEAQWKNYERLPTPIPPMNRKYNLYKFICAVCGVETYRKRVRTLPFQEFPFLANQRAPGSLTLGNNPLAVVCLDCSETLWAQSAEYDRWGLPVHKRHFNWMARPPPPEDSVEATVARLPSGETQLPRCPPIEPVLLVKPKEVPPLSYEHISSSRSRSRSSKSESKSETSRETSLRKTSLSSSGSNPNLDVVAHSQPPVVTVAPMSSHTTLSSLRKETLSVPPNLSAVYPKYDCGLQPHLGPPPIFPTRSPMFSPASYSHFPWGGRDGSLNDHYAYSSLDGLQQNSTNSSWSWLPPPTSNLVPYQTFMPSSFNRSFALNEPYYNASHSYYPPSPETNMSSISTNASSSYLSPFSLQNSGRSSPTYVSQVPSTPNSSTTDNSSAHQRQSSSVSSNEPEVHVRKVATDGKSSSVRTTAQDSMPRKLNHVKDKAAPTKTVSDLGNRGTTPKKSFSSLKVEPVTGGSTTKSCKESNFKSSTSTNLYESDTLPTNFKPKSNAIRKHNKEKLMNSGQWKSSSSKSISDDVTVGSKTVIAGNEVNMNKWHRQSQGEKNTSGKNRHSTTSTSETEPVDFSISLNKEKKTKMEKNEYNVRKAFVVEGGDSASIHSDIVMDLSLSTKNSKNASSSSTNFMIAYLCQSECTPSSSCKPEIISHDNSKSKEVTSDPEPSFDLNTGTDGDNEPSGRRSVIVTLPKSENLEDSETENAPSTFQVPVKALADNSLLSSSSEPVEIIMKIPTEESKTCDENMTDKESSCDVDMDQTTQNDKIGVPDESTATSSAGTKNKVVIEMDLSPFDSWESLLKSQEIPKINHQLESAQEIVKKIISDHKQEARNARIRKRKLEADQEEFLSTLGLITPQKKSDVELDILIRRCQHHTLPPLKLRPSTPPKEEELTTEFEKKLLQIAFDDPSTTRQNDLNHDEVSFLANLGLKPASKSEKTRRENEWRYVLAERMMREKRGKHLVQRNKKPWFSGAKQILTPLIKSPKTENSDVFGSLSLTLPSQESQTEFTSASGSDLLTIASSHNQSMNTSKPESITVSAMCIVQPVISYPKYIPSYAASVPPTNSCASILNEDTIPGSSVTTISGPTSSPCLEEKVSSNVLTAIDDNISQTEIQNMETDQMCNPALEDSIILKVPVISTTELTVDTNHHDDDTTPNKDNNNAPPIDNDSETPGIKGQIPSAINAIIQADAINFGHFENEINNLLKGIPTSPNCKTDAVCHWPGSLSDWRNLKNHLKSRQSKVKAIEENLKKREKQILKYLRAHTKNTQ